MSSFSTVLLIVLFTFLNKDVAEILSIKLESVTKMSMCQSETLLLKLDLLIDEKLSDLKKNQRPSFKSNVILTHRNFLHIDIKLYWYNRLLAHPK